MGTGAQMIENLKIHWAPEYAWRCHLVPGVVYHLAEGRQPNAFHRLMQRLWFGVRWERINGNRK
jgi:hypothetical protein